MKFSSFGLTSFHPSLPLPSPHPHPRAEATQQLPRQRQLADKSTSLTSSRGAVDAATTSSPLCLAHLAVARSRGLDPPQTYHL
jgi:hypothetical protein